MWQNCYWIQIFHHPWQCTLGNVFTYTIKKNVTSISEIHLSDRVYFVRALHLCCTCPLVIFTSISVIIYDRTCEKGPIDVLNYIEFQCQTKTSVNFRQKVFRGDSVSTTIHLPSCEVLEPITGSFTPSTLLRDGSLFLDFTWPCQYGKINAHAYATK